MSRAVLPRDLTSYDLLKTLAVFLMVADHIGFFFFPGDDWWRVFGRMCVPVWFFLIGYAQSRDLGARLWGGAVVMTLSDLAFGHFLFPVNMLGTVILLRLTLDSVMGRALRDARTFWAVQATLLLLAVPSGMFFEYGTLAFVLSGVGYLARRRGLVAGGADLSPHLLLQYAAFAAAGFIAMQGIVYGFDRVQVLAMACGIIAVTGLCLSFRPVSLPALTARLPGFAAAFLRFTGRWTLEIYVVHLLLFKAVSTVLWPEHFLLFHWTLFYTAS